MMSTASSLATEMRYRDVAAAADWLCTAFGFEKQSVALSGSGAVHYAQLTFGNAMLMLAPVRNTSLDRFMKQPDETGGAETQSCYFVVDDAGVHYARAKAAGAEILLDLQDDVFGGRGYSCRDPEGHIWAFGTYDPWQGERPQPATARGSNRRAVLAVLAAAMIVSAVAAAWMSSALRAAVSSMMQVQEPPFQEKVAFETEQRAREAADRAAQEAREQLEIEFAAVTAAAERANQALIDAARSAREAAERAAQEARDNLERERAARAAAAQHGEDLQKRAAEAERAREAAERAAQEAREQLEIEFAAATAAAERANQAQIDAARTAREAAEQVAQEARDNLDRERAARAAAAQHGEDVQKRAAEAERARAAAERAAEEAKLALEQVQKRVADEQSAREAAVLAARAAREQLSREQRSKTAAWRANAQLRREPSQAQISNPPSQTAGSAKAKQNWKPPIFDPGHPGL